VVFDLDVKHVEDLRRWLRELGYSERAVKEILKWYSSSTSE